MGGLMVRDAKQVLRSSPNEGVEQSLNYEIIIMNPNRIRLFSRRSQEGQRNPHALGLVANEPGVLARVIGLFSVEVQHR